MNNDCSFFLVEQVSNESLMKSSCIIQMLFPMLTLATGKLTMCTKELTWSMPPTRFYLIPELVQIVKHLSLILHETRLY